MIYCASFNQYPTENISSLDEAQLPGTTQDHLQIFNIEAKAKMKSYQMPEQASSHCLEKLTYLKESGIWFDIALYLLLYFEAGLSG